MDLAPCGAFHAPYDTAGRLSADTVTSLGPASDPTRAVDGSVLQIATAYDDMGRVATVTSYADVAGTSPVNQVEYVYNGWGTVDSEYQEPNGAVDTTTSVYVQYDYDDGSYTDPKGATAASYLRLDLVWYPANPNGGGSNFVNYLYRLDPSDGTIDNMMSRVDDIETTGVNDLMFRYLGAGTIATEDLSDLDIELDYSAPSSTSTAANFGTWDRFGRVRDQLWASYGSEWSAFGPANADPDHFTYTYDREGNVTSEASPQNTNFSQTYTYDALNRLTSSTRGDGLANQTWGLDGVGNMATVTMTSSTPQSRTVNAANEIAASSGIVTPLYDAAGNTIYGPSALQGQQATPVHCVYDAWNRLVAVYTDNRSGGLGAEIAGYQYDGLNRRVKKSLFDPSGNPTGGDQYYYNQNGQVIEDDSVDTNGVAQSIDQYVWGPGSADAPLVCLHDGNADGDPTNDDYYTDWRRYYLTDANGNVTTMIRFGADPVFGSDEIAYVTRVVYTAYGTATEMGEDWTGAGVEYAFDGPLYCGYWHDTETGLSQTQNRYYNPNLSTWINRDPIGYQGGNDLYGYVGDDPTSQTDPTGLANLWNPITWGLNNPSQGWSGFLNPFSAENRAATGTFASTVVVEEIYGGGKALATGEAGAALGNRAVRIVQTQTGTAFTGTASDWARFGRGVTGDLVGVNSVVEAGYGYDISSRKQLDAWERSRRGAAGISALAGTAAGGISTAARYPTLFPTAARAARVGAVTPTSVVAPSVTGSTADFTMWASAGKAKGIIGSLNEQGMVEFAVEAGPEATPRGSVLFEQMMDHFGGSAKGVVGSWTYGSNLAEFNALTGQGMSAEQAAAATWTGTQAARQGFSAVNVVRTVGNPGAYTKVLVNFTRPGG